MVAVVADVAVTAAGAAEIVAIAETAATAGNPQLGSWSFSFSVAIRALPFRPFHSHPKV
jgi:hypothetical protein